LEEQHAPSSPNQTKESGNSRNISARSSRVILVVSAMNGNCPGNQPGDQARKYGTPGGTTVRGPILRWIDLRPGTLRGGDEIPQDESFGKVAHWMAVDIHSLAGDEPHLSTRYREALGSVDQRSTLLTPTPPETAPPETPPALLLTTPPAPSRRSSTCGVSTCGRHSSHPAAPPFPRRDRRQAKPASPNKTSAPPTAGHGNRLPSSAPDAPCSVSCRPDIRGLVARVTSGSGPSINGVRSIRFTSSSIFPDSIA
jgi:hypothetical protein